MQDIAIEIYALCFMHMEAGDSNLTNLLILVVFFFCRLSKTAYILTKSINDEVSYKVVTWIDIKDENRQ